ncbi:unnamed protein product [Psylliodes chrysocephalus]|uniref:Peroxidase n=1 Tax=Psylliodes chrysocephalus TaxID=3402493 RepID=A0A9P0GCZ4_9CUCU|nr:unnamed protein product [Psylliodes chrysocephala]
MTLLAINFSVYLLLITTVKYHEAVVCGTHPDSCPPEKIKYRPLDGSCNNLENPGMGTANQPYARFIEKPNYSDGISKPPVAKSGKPLPNARFISEQTSRHIPTERANVVRLVSGIHQFIAHDHSVTLLRSADPCCTSDMRALPTTPESCFNIDVPDNDPYYSQHNVTCMPITKTTTTINLNCTATNPKPYADQISGVTAALDLNIVYGSTESEANELRTFSEGRLITRNGRYLPLGSGCATPPNTPNICYKTGDFRANQNLDLTISHITWVRFHEWCCDRMVSINPHWNDERIYQECRKLNIAVYQHLAFSEMFPALIGYKAMEKRNLLYPYKLSEGRSTYDPHCEINPLNEFSTAGYRVVHAILVASLKMANEKRDSMGDLQLTDHLNNPAVLERDDMFDHLIRGGTCQRANKVGSSFDPDLTRNLRFDVSPLKFGIDIHAADIQRGRDHALASYSAIRSKCGLKKATTFDDFLDAMTKENADLLASVYEDAQDVELIIGATLETAKPHSVLGPTAECLFLEALERIQKCDRYWWDNNQNHFTDPQLESIRSMTVASLLCLAGDNIRNMQRYATKPIHPIDNPIVSCADQPPMSMEAFRETTVLHSMKSFFENFFSRTKKN